MSDLAPAGAGGPPRFVLSRGLFLRLLGLVYLVAFASLATQILGLIGADGLLPAAAYLEPLTVRQDEAEIAPTRTIQLRDYPSNEDLNALIVAFGEKRTELANVLRRIAEIEA